MRPPFAYFGGKVGMAQTIADLLPPHRVYIEPFFGSGAVLFAKRPARHEIVNDLDGAVVAFFRVLRDRPDELARACRLTPYARAEYEAAELDGGDTPLDDLELARRFWARVNQSFGRTAGRRTGWSITQGQNQSHPVGTVGRVGRFEACSARLARVAIERCDAIELLDRLATHDAVVYCDPPYLRAVRKNASSTDYRCDLPEDGDHRRLAEALHRAPATVILSGYASELYDELYGEWWRRDFPVTLRSSNAARTDRPARTEVLWSNRPLEDHGRLPFSAHARPTEA